MKEKFIFDSKKKNKKIKLFSQYDGIANKEMLDGVNIQIFSNKEILIDGCNKVADFSAEYLKLKITKGYLIIYGTDFNIINFEGKIIDVLGNINSLEFCM